MKKYYLMLLFALSGLCLQAQVDNDSITQIIMKHGLDKSEVMETASWLCDVYGPRLTGSPMLDKATEWTVSTLEEWGMSNVHLDEWGPFGRGWELALAIRPAAWSLLARWIDLTQAEQNPGKSAFVT